MILHEPETRVEDGNVWVSARVEVKNSKIDLPNELWFRFPERWQGSLSKTSDGFASSLFLLASHLKEPLEIRGAVSERLVWGMDLYQRIFQHWFPNLFQVVDLRPARFADPATPAHTAGASFSGGVNSFYTLWSHLPQNEPRPSFRIGYALFVHGFDIPLEDKLTYPAAYDAYHQMMSQLGIELIGAATNIRQFSRGINWNVYFGGPLIGVAQMVAPLFSRYYIPAGHLLDTNIPRGSDLRIDHLLSTEQQEVIHDGAHVGRLDKTRIISEWPVSYDYLRVCWTKLDGIKNCCRCEKCVRTMTTLDLFGKLEEYSTFPQPLTRSAVRRTFVKDKNRLTYVREIMTEASARGRSDIQRDLRWALASSALIKRWRKIQKRLAPYQRKVARLRRRVFTRLGIESKA